MTTYNLVEDKIIHQALKELADEIRELKEAKKVIEQKLLEAKR